MKELDRLQQQKIIDTMHEIPLLSGLSMEELSQLQEGLTLYRVRRGEMVFMTGEPADRMYIIVEGMIKIYDYLLDGREQLLYIYRRHDFVGGFNLLKDDSYRYNAKALQEGVILTLHKSMFNRIAMKNPQTVLRILEKAYDRIRWAEGLIERLNAPTSEMKVAGLLLEFMQEFGVRRGDRMCIHLPINREEMGSFSGLSRETVTRRLNALRDERIIDFEGNRIIIILDLKALQAITAC